MLFLTAKNVINYYLEGIRTTKMAICLQKSVTLLKFNMADAWDLSAG